MRIEGAMRTKGQRVFTEMVNDKLQAKRRYGTIERDSIDGWDYDDVSFDDMPNMTQPILAYYLHDTDETDKHLTGLVFLDSDGVTILEHQPFNRPDTEG
jgi:hypothetical protein